jgi:hypothetical protein
MIAVLLKLFVFPHQPFVRVLQEATFLFQAYFGLWECYTIKSAGKIRLEEERRFLQDSNKWLVRENSLI